MKPTVMRANPDEDNYLLESRVRENRMHGSVGGEDVSPSLPYQTVHLNTGQQHICVNSILRSINSTSLYYYSRLKM